MSEKPALPSHLRDRDQMEHLISLLTQLLENKPDEDLTETIQEFVTSNQRILDELQRIATSLEDAAKTVSVQEQIDQRLDMIDRQMAEMNHNLTRLLAEMMAPLDE